MNKVIKSYILFLFLLFGLFATVEAMQPSTNRQKLVAQLIVFKQTLTSGFSWIMQKISQYYQSWFSTPTQTTTQKFSSWKDIPGAIYFFDKNKSYYDFTNFSEKYSFRIGNDTWKTVEQYYQAGKFTDLRMQKTIRDFTTAKETAAHQAFDFAQKKAHLKRKDWEQINIREFMLGAIRAKFLQNKDLQKQLIDTGDKILIEDSPKDKFYGRGPDWKGQNHLGRILMHVRDEIKNNKMNEYDPKTTYSLSTLK